MTMKLMILGALAVAVAVMTGCAATSVAVSHRNLDVQSKMSDSIFLEPSAVKTVYLEVRNTSDKPDFVIERALRAAIEAHGYQVQTDPDTARLQLQVNVLSVGKGALTASQMGTGSFGSFGSPVDGALASMAVVSAVGGRGYGAAGLVGGAADFIAGAAVKNVTYSAVTDVQISQRTATAVRVASDQNLSQGSAGGERSSFDETSNFKRYRTRVVSTANKVNLKWEDAEPALIQGLATSIGGIL